MSTIPVFVTKKHIERGISGSRSECPIALAIVDAFEAIKIEVLKIQVVNRIEIKDISYSWYPIDVPQKINEWILQFDKGEDVPEMSFVIRRKKRVFLVQKAVIEKLIIH